MALVKCEFCGKDISEKAAVCPHCGTPREITTTCPECGATIPVNATECPVCGCPVESVSREQPMFSQPQTKFCQSCGATIPAAAIICTKCGCQTGQMKAETPNIVITNTNVNSNTNNNMGRGFGSPKNKWVSFCLCLFAGYFGAHKFYEGKAGTGLLYLFTFGLFGFGWIIDCLNLLAKPNPYYV